MSEKKSFFSFLRGTNSRAEALSKEDAQQREYAIEQAQRYDDEFEVDMDIDNESDFDDEVAAFPQGPVSDELVAFTVESLTALLNDCGFSSEISIVKNENGKLFLEIVNSVDAGRIIGREGQNIESFQTLIRAVVYKKYGYPVKIILDAGDYRRRRQNMLRSNALRAARGINPRRSKVELKPMNAAERRIIHLLFKNNKKIRTFSVGEGSKRHVVLEHRVSQGGRTKNPNQ